MPSTLFAFFRAFSNRQVLTAIIPPGWEILFILSGGVGLLASTTG
jgi:hypothetical protein